MSCGATLLLSITGFIAGCKASGTDNHTNTASGATVASHLAAQPRALRGCHLTDIVGAFDQQNVRPARPCKRVSRAAADGAAADDDDFSIRELIHSYCCSSRSFKCRTILHLS